MYLDTAILIKLLVREQDSQFYAERIDGESGVWSSQLALTECWSALCRKEREGAISARTRRAAWTRFERYLASRSLQVLPVSEAVLRHANVIIERCHPDIALRTLDAIHLASCEALGAFPLWTNDQRMRDAARLLRFPLGPTPGGR